MVIKINKKASHKLKFKFVETNKYRKKILSKINATRAKTLDT